MPDPVVAAMPNRMTAVLGAAVVMAVAPTDAELADKMATGGTSRGVPGSMPEKAVIAPLAPETVPVRVKV